MKPIERVIILNTDREKPVYHHFDDVVYEPANPPGRRHVVVMSCGATYYSAQGWWTSHLRRDHADRFARPCRRCFPGLS